MNPKYFALIIVFGIFSCGNADEQPNIGGNSSEYASEVKILDELILQVSAAESTFKDLPMAQVNHRLDSVPVILQFVKDNYGGSMNENDALILADYRETKNIVKKIESRAPRVEAEISRTTSQLNGLRNSILQKATKDKKGSIIDKAYIEKQMIAETQAANNLISSITELKERTSRFISEYDKKLMLLTPYLESLKN